MIQREVGEQTGVRDAEEKQNFLDGKTRYIDAQDVLWIEAPDADVCKKHVPKNEDNGADEDGGKHELPFPGEVGFWIKTEKKWNDEGKQINAEVKIFRFQ